MIREQQAKIQMMTAEEKLKAPEGKLKTQQQLLDLAQQALTKRKLSSSMVISSAVANAAALFKNHLADLDMEILHKDLTIDDAEQKALANSAYDATHEFVPCIIFPISPSPMTTTIPGLFNLYLCCNEP
jgi:hypothetical protein